MYVVNAEFQDIYEISLGHAVAEIGVYVLWSKGAVERPSYVGEGRVVDRIVRHMSDTDKPFAGGRYLEGAVAVLRDGPHKQRKTDAEILEITLLETASKLGISPPHNSQPGKLASVYRRGERHDTIRINISGRHPLRLDSRVRGTARLTWRWDDYVGWDLIEIPWRRS